MRWTAGAGPGKLLTITVSASKRDARKTGRERPIAEHRTLEANDAMVGKPWTADCGWGGHMKVTGSQCQQQYAVVCSLDASQPGVVC